MKVLFLNSGNLFGGVETMQIVAAHFRDTCPEIEQHYGACFEGKFAEAVRREGCPMYVVPPVKISRPWTVWKARRHLREILKKTQFDVVICHAVWTLLVFGAAVRAAGLPLVLWLHDPPQEKPHPIEIWVRRIVPDAMICNSRYTMALSRRLYGDVPTECIYCPVEPVGADRESRTQARARIGTPMDRVVILQVGRLERHKGHLAHLEALHLLAANDRWEVWFTGSAQKPGEEAYLSELKSAAERLGLADRVKFLGWQPSMHELYRAADIYCQPNIGAEPFGITFIEALSAGLPVIGTRLAGPAEIITPECGFLVEPGNAPALADALRTLIDNADLRQSLGANGPALAKEIGDPAKHLHQMAKTLSEVLSARRT